MKYIYTLFLMSLFATQFSYSSESSDGYKSDPFEEFRQEEYASEAKFNKGLKQKKPSPQPYILIVGRKSTILPEPIPLYSGNNRSLIVGKRR